MKRETLNVYDVEWDEVKGKATQIAIANVWRTLPERDVDDLVQDAYFKFLQCKERFVGETLLEFQRYFCQAFKRSILTLAVKRWHRRHESGLVAVGVHGDLLDIDIEAPSHAPQVDHTLDLQLAPPPLRQLFYACNVDEGTRHYDDGTRETTRERMARLSKEVPSYLRRADGTRETTNEWLCRRAGLDPRRYDLIGMLVAFLKGQPIGESECTI